LAGFFIDLGIAAVTLFGLSLISGLLWGLYRGVVVGYANAQAGAGAPDASSVAASLGQPGALAQILMALFATGGAAAAVLLATAGQRRRAPRVAPGAAPSLHLGLDLLVATLIVPAAMASPSWPSSSASSRSPPIWR
jgi:phosphotransferase system  glucose/maltose/N-acetylglucosamine-specific IIC component